MHMQKAMMPQGRIVNKRQANKNNVSGKIIWIEKVTRSARSAKIDVASRIVLMVIQSTEKIEIARLCPCWVCTFVNSEMKDSLHHERTFFSCMRASRETCVCTVMRFSIWPIFETLLVRWECNCDHNPLCWIWSLWSLGLIPEMASGITQLPTR
jgi:hypothetical protein